MIPKNKVVNKPMHPPMRKRLKSYLKSICFNIVIAVTTLGFLPLSNPNSSIFEEINAVVNSVSAAVPAPQHRIDSVI